MEFKVKNTESNLQNAIIECKYGNLEYDLSESEKMIIIKPYKGVFPYLNKPSQFRKALGF